MKGTASNEMKMATSGQMKDVNSLVIQAVPELTFEEATIILRKKGEMITRLQACFPRATTKNNAVASWELFYREVFGITADFSKLELPERRSGFDRLIIVAAGLTQNQVYNTCAKYFPCWRYTDDLDAAVPINDRTSAKAYAVWSRDRVEADEELANLSADYLVGRKIKGITLLERMLYELKYFLETGGHLDIQNWTLCSGSRYSDGTVPDAGWDDDGFKVGGGSSVYRSDYLRSREAVSL